MIKITTNDDFVLIKTFDLSPELFQAINAVLKMYKCKYDPKTTCWKSRVGIYDDTLKDLLEEYDYLEEDEQGLAILRQGKPEQVISKVRVIPDYSNLKFPPLVGKAPNENFQRVDIAKGLTRNRFAFFWGMGTGKTYASSALIDHYYLMWKTVGKVVIISTSIGARNVYEEIIQFIPDLPKSKICIADKNNRAPFTEDIDIVVTSYNSFRLVCNHYKKELKIKSAKPRTPFLPLKEWSKGKNLMLLLDESQEISNRNSYQGYFVWLHSSLFTHRYLFTGTFADKPEKMYNQLKTLDPYLVKNLPYSDWLMEYANVGTKYSQYGVRSWKKEKLKELNETLRKGYASFRETEDVLELPTHYRKTIGVDMSPLHRKLYEAIVTEDLNNLGQASMRKTINRFPFLMLAVDCPSLLEKHEDLFSPETNNLIRKIKTKHLAKFDVIDDILETHAKEKGVLWVEHPATAELLAKRYEKLNPIVITGSTPDKDRANLIEAFKKNKKNQLLIANIKVLNTSVTITEATFQVYVELIFAYVPYEQSTKRIYRYGQNKTVTTYILLYHRSLDYLRVKNLESKGILIKGLLKKDFLTQEEWVKVFNLDDGMDI